MGELKQEEDQVYVKSQVDGKLIKVTAIFADTREANIYLVTNKGEGVVYQADDLVFCAKLKDLGI